LTVDSSSAPLLQFRQVTLEVEGRRFLDGAELRVDAGESVIVAGTPGSGKSFVLRLLLGLPGIGDAQVVLRGEVIVAGQSVFELGGNDLQVLRRRIGFVMQEGGLIENMDIRRNVTLPIQYHFRDMLSDGSLADRRCDQLLERFDISHLGSSGLRPVSLDHEQKIYVALARALVMDPFLLLLDDPMIGLSPDSAQRLCHHAFDSTSLFTDRLPGETTESLTHLLTTADLGGYLEHGDRFVLLDDGHLIDVGDRTAVETSDDPRLARVLKRDPIEVGGHG
jgi:ABC-type transporter Mla maintaining outer membrane lipid asymmetry ATPase subunit MlaF|tara:strand:+ start:2105 stop:2941 length:837 start_codon:yes stop_codon:yes gene_type:complete